MASKRIDRTALAEVIRNLDGISNDQRADLLQLLNDQKRYGLVWEEHSEKAEEKLREQLPVLKEVEERRILSDDAESPNHILIEGDNLHALTALTYTHEGKVDVIYIDPPYNTGNKDFIYNDSFVDAEDGYRHSKWLSFMSKRLRIAKKLLSDRGVIFISIDDNEQANLKLLCDEVFGEKNLISNIIWRKQGGGKSDSKFLANNCEYILSYKKNNLNKFNGQSVDESIFNKVDEKGRKYRLMSLDFGSLSYSPSLDYPITLPNGIVCYPDSKETYEIRKNGNYNHHDWCWRVNPEEYKRRLEAGRIEFTFNKRNNKWKVQERLFLDEKEEGGVYSNLIDDFTNRLAKNQLKEIFDSVVFNYPKPIDLIKFLEMLYPLKNTAILDFFAGSGTTLHATMQLNAEDGGKRQCILVTNNENKICEEVTYERNKRVINGYTTPKGEQVEGLKNNNLRYYKVDFVERDSSVNAKKKLMEASTELLCIKQDLYAEKQTFGSIKLNPRYARYFDDGKKQMLIIYNTDAIESLVGEIEKMSADINIMTYVFSTNNYALDADFEDVADKVTLCALPAAIYNAYFNVLPKKVTPKTEEDETETIPGE